MIARDPRHVLGSRGEDLAADFFIQNGFAIVARNWKCDRGELDLVIRKENEMRVIEVKTRQDQPEFADTHETVSETKLRKVGEAAALFFAAHPFLPDLPHYDVFTVRFAGDGPPVYQWLKDFE